jgi:7-keto-8-aminopelargonate synthetase-like enzyme
MWRQYSTLRQPLTVLVSNQLKHASFKQKGLANIQTRFRHAKSKNVEKLLGGQ